MNKMEIIKNIDIILLLNIISINSIKMNINYYKKQNEFYKYILIILIFSLILLNIFILIYYILQLIS